MTNTSDHFEAPRISVNDDGQYVIWFPRSTVGLAAPETPENQAAIAHAWGEALQLFRDRLMEHFQQQARKLPV